MDASPLESRFRTTAQAALAGASTRAPRANAANFALDCREANAGLGPTALVLRGLGKPATALRRGVLAAAVGGWLSLGAGIACIDPISATDLELVKKEFPGITLQVPRGTPSIDLTSTANGLWRMEKLGRRRGLVSIVWQTGHTGQLTPESFAEGLAVNQTIAQSSGTAIRVGDHDGQLLTTQIKGHLFLMSQWHCDQHDRDYSLSTMILEPQEAARAFHHRLATRVQCHIGDKPETVLSRPLVSLPPTYGFQTAADPIAFANLDGGELFFLAFPGTAVEAIVTDPEFVTKMFLVDSSIVEARLDGPTVKAKATDGSDRSIIRLRLREDGELTLISLTAIKCHGEQSFLAVHSYSDLAERSASEAAMLTATCTGGAPIQKYLTVDEAFANACAAGDARGCYKLAGLADEADPPKSSVSQRYYRLGCELEDPESCNNLGAMLTASGGDGVAKQAITLYAKACDLGLKLGCTNADVARQGKEFKIP